MIRKRHAGPDLESEMADKSAHKERTRARILDEAAQALRADGTQGVSVAALMKRAGLTHGGFYAHFTSRDDLVVHAIDHMFADSTRVLAHFLAQDRDAPGSDDTGNDDFGNDDSGSNDSGRDEPGDDPVGLAALIDFYLSEQAFDTPGRSCPIPGLAGEACRMPAAARRRFERGIADFNKAIGRALAPLHGDAAPELASAIFAEMIGSMLLARSFADRKTATDLLMRARARLKRRAGVAGA
jgi:TetR/AcrR family transcriptional repressor of nem operon